MKFDNNGSDTEYEKPAAKTHPARLVGVYDIGVQPGNVYQGEKMQDKAQVVFVYELLGKDKQTTGKNFTISEFLTVSLHIKGTMPKRLAALGVPMKKKNDDWYEAPAGLNLSSLIGEPAMVEVVISEAGKSKVGNVMAPIDGMVISEYTEKLGYLDLDSDDYLDKFTTAPAWIQKMCQKSVGWNS